MFGGWWDNLSPEEQGSVRDHVELLRTFGATLAFPYSSGIAGSRHTHMGNCGFSIKGGPIGSFMLSILAGP